MAKNTNGFKNMENNLTFQIDYTANFNKAFRREFQEQVIKADVTTDECAILFAIDYNPDISQSELAKLLFKGKAHVGKILNDMETRGLVKRIADTRDNIIIKRNEITPKGKEILKQGYTAINKIKKAVENEFSKEDLDQFKEYLKRYRKVLRTFVDVKLK
ncbi:MarR family transcriptional regulator [bacterium]|nr:MarR family transcriptional regulator [bacterium]